MWVLAIAGLGQEFRAQFSILVTILRVLIE